MSEEQTRFEDTDHLPPDWQDAIEWCRNVGISNGTSAATFDPDAPVTRGHMALFMHRLARSIVDQTIAREGAEIEEIKRLKLEPGDHLLVKLPEDATLSDIENAKSAFAVGWPDVRVVFHGVPIEVQAVYS